MSPNPPSLIHTHPRTTWALVILSLAVLALVVAVSTFHWNSLRPALARHISTVTGRPTVINGDLKVHLWSWNPTVEVNDLAISNPSWTESNLMFGAKQITVSVSLGRLLRGQLVLPQVDLREPNVNLERDAAGRASWELGNKQGTPNHNTEPVKLPAIRRLNIEDGKIHVVDKIRKLAFSGSLIAAEQDGKQDASALQLLCSGTLNAKPFHLEAHGGPLLALDPHKPYTFFAHVTAADINLQTEVTVIKPFDLGNLHAGLVITGDDLADVYYLTGLALPNTPHYRLSATLDVDGTTYKIDNLKGQLGKSDIAGTLTLQTAGKIPKMTATLSSRNLDIADLAPTLGQAAQATPARASLAPQAALPAANRGYLLPDANLQVKRVRGMDADLNYRAAAVTAPKIPMKEVRLHLLLKGGLLTLDPLSFVLDKGQFSGRVQIDARNDIPASDIDMRIDDIDLSQFKSAKMKQAPLSGTLQGRLQVRGTGASIHKFASTSDGALSVVIPHGEVNETFAELTGINVLHALGLLVKKGDERTDVRCGVIDFKDRQGILNTTTVYVDTTNVLITGRGNINLNSEAVNLDIQGDPKKLRLLRIRAPITLGGTLRKPAIGIKPEKLAEQTGVAAALATLLTPVAAALAFVDPGLAKDKDCSSILSQANAGVRN